MVTLLSLSLSLSSRSHSCSWPADSVIVHWPFSLSGALVHRLTFYDCSTRPAPLPPHSSNHGRTRIQGTLSSRNFAQVRVQSGECTILYISTLNCPSVTFAAPLAHFTLGAPLHLHSSDTSGGLTLRAAPSYCLISPGQPNAGFFPLFFGYRRPSVADVNPLNRMEAQPS